MTRANSLCFVFGATFAFAIGACSSTNDVNGSVPADASLKDANVSIADGPIGPTPDAGAQGDIVRFVVLGDGGEGNSIQYAVSTAIASECGSRGGCDFALYLGDNIYNSGVDSVDDMQFITKFEMPYAALDFPFYVVLGNHDYGGGGGGYEFYKGDFQVDYTAESDKWTMPSHYYTESVGRGTTTIDIFGLDTNDIMYTGSSTQGSWLDGALAASTATWKLAFGHHTYISNGKHGSAGNYEGLALIPILNGGNIRTFVDDHVCGAADIYFCGHDHTRQWLEPRCGTEFIVSGTAAKTTDLVGLDERDTYFETDLAGGYMMVEIQGKTMTGWFYDETGTLEFTRSYSKP